MKNMILIIGIHIFFLYFILPASQIRLLDLLSRLFPYFFTPIVPSSENNDMDKKKTQRKRKLTVKKKQKATRVKKQRKDIDVYID